jgi:hypothetical protein
MAYSVIARIIYIAAFAAFVGCFLFFNWRRR